jgi:hypothetical protein
MTSLRAKRALDQLRRIRPFLLGSLSITTKRCGNPRCRCAAGGPLHEAVLLTWKEENRTRTMYVPIELREEVAACVEEAKHLKRLVREVSEEHRAFLAARRKSSKR